VIEVKKEGMRAMNNTPNGNINTTPSNETVKIEFLNGKAVVKIGDFERQFDKLEDINPAEIGIELRSLGYKIEPRDIILAKIKARKSIEAVLKGITHLEIEDAKQLPINERLEYLDSERLKNMLKAKLEELGVEYKRDIIAEAKKSDLAWAIYLLNEELKILDFIVVRYSDGSHELWVYDKGIAIPDGKAYVARLSKKIADKYATKMCVSEAVLNFETGSPIIDYKDLDPIGYLPLKNVILNLETLTVIDYPQRIGNLIFTKKLDIEIDTGILELIRLGEIDYSYWNHVAPTWIQFLKRFYVSDSENPPYRQLEKLEDLLGSIFMPQVTKKKLGLIIGEPNTGKSTLQYVLKKVLGPYVSTLTMDALSNNRFAIAELRGKLLNIAVEKPKSRVDIEILKRITGGDTVIAENKFKPLFHFTPVATQIFLMNSLPTFRELDEAILDRFYFIFPQNALDPKEKDERFREKLAEEREAILHYLLWCYWNLKQRNYVFRHEFDVNTKIDLVEEYSSPVWQFVNEECVEDHDYRIERKKLYEAYIQWARENAKEPITTRKFYAVLRTKFLEVTISGKRYFRGLTLKKEVEGEQLKLDNKIENIPYP